MARKKTSPQQERLRASREIGQAYQIDGKKLTIYWEWDEHGWWWMKSSRPKRA